MLLLAFRQGPAELTTSRAQAQRRTIEARIEGLALIGCGQLSEYAARRLERHALLAG
jgi:hypothetical protein